MARRIAVLLLLVLALAQGSALACAEHCAAMHRSPVSACCAAMQAGTQREGRAAWDAPRQAVAPQRPLCAGAMFAAPWRKARPVPQQGAGMACDMVPAPSAWLPVSRPADRQRGREVRIAPAHSIPLRI